MFKSMQEEFQVKFKNGFTVAVKFIEEAKKAKVEVFDDAGEYVLFPTGELSYPSATSEQVCDIMQAVSYFKVGATAKTMNAYTEKLMSGDEEVGCGNKDCESCSCKDSDDEKEMLN